MYAEYLLAVLGQMATYDGIMITATKFCRKITQSPAFYTQNSSFNGRSALLYTIGPKCESLKFIYYIYLNF